MGAIDPYASGVLKEEVHDRLVADIDAIATQASIQPHWIWTPLAETVSPAEAQWVKGFRTHAQENMSGLCLVGATASAMATTHMAAITGALIRNFIDARMFTTSTLFDQSEKDSVPNPRCLLIPNFFVGKSLGPTLAPWRIDMLQNLMFERHLAGRQSVVYISKMDDCSSEYGDVLTQIFKNHYYVVQLKS